MAEQGSGADVADGREDLEDTDVERIERIVRRVVRARMRDQASGDDLVQETMARVLERLGTAEVRDVDQYAATVAVNLVRRRWADDARERAVLPEVIDLRDSVTPDDAAVDADVAAALRGALAELEPDKREALVAHEVAGVPTAELAAEGSTPGAVAASLARTRARLRVSFLLRYRRIELPSTSCRPVLESISAHDARRQERLAATGHLEACPTCRDLAPLLRERGVAWLGLSPALASLVRRREVQVGAAALAVAVAVAAVAVVRTDDADRRPPPVAAGAELPAAPTSPGPTTSPSPGDERLPVTSGRTAGDPPRTTTPETGGSAAGVPDRSEPPARPPAPADQPHEAPTVHLPAELPVVGDDVVLDHPALEPLEPVVCPVLELPVPVASCRSDEPSDLEPSVP